jgi:hypothetical protein
MNTNVRTWSGSSEVAIGLSEQRFGSDSIIREYSSPFVAFSLFAAGL